MLSYTQLGQIIKGGREAKKMTQQDIAKKLNVTVAAVSNWENGIRAPRIPEFIQLVNLLEIADQIFILSSSASPTWRADSEIDKIKSQLFLLQQRMNKFDQVEV